jgi:AAA+ ATPase superfamily predicted ATPase
MFIGRRRGLAKLDELYASERFECVIVYGRRRIGKTTLIQQFTADKPAIYSPDWNRLPEKTWLA